ncbi:MAG: TolB family protein [Bacteroidota bacterium]
MLPVMPPPSTVDTLITKEIELAEGEMPAVSPDGSKIVFTRNGDIFVCDTNGWQLAQLTSGAEIDVHPRWHPNGQTIGFIRKNVDEENKGLIFAVPTTGGIATQIVVNQFVGDDLLRQSRLVAGVTIPIWDWSPDGKYIALFSEVERNVFLNVVFPQDTSLMLNRKIYDFSSSNTSSRTFAWSINPDEIAFVATSIKNSGEVRLINFTTMEEVVDSIVNFPDCLTRSPYQTKFAFQSTHSSSVILTDFVTTFGSYYIFGGAFGLKWSPNERYLLFEQQGSIPGPFGYSYSKLLIYDIQRNKLYELMKKGDINRHNYFFEFGKNSNTVYFERYSKINKITFQHTN